MRCTAIPILLVCNSSQTTGFARPRSKYTRRVLQRVHPKISSVEPHSNTHHPPEGDHRRISNINTSETLPSLSRRKFLAAAALVPIVSCNAARALDEPLSQLLIGQGSWTDQSENNSQLSESQVSLFESVVPPSFTTYLARFLILYDPSAFKWWTERVESYSLLTSQEARRREGREFASFASSVRLGVIEFLASGIAKTSNYNFNSGTKRLAVSSEAVKDKYTTLLETMLDKYGAAKGTLRHIGLLFAMLPAEYQPTDAMRTRFGISTVQSASEGTAKKSYLPPNFVEQISALLPSEYTPIYSPTTKSCAISPPLQLYEIGFNEEFGTTAIATLFGPLSRQPLVRQRPELGKGYYGLLGISGGIGCALTHSLVIPLDVVK